ncbi:MAG: hypothetical protein LBG93_07280 [Treponema sp.]|jgi:hypothetical protein|nr:hypothetical protein [Treponema sp.]
MKRSLILIPILFAVLSFVVFAQSPSLTITGHPAPTTILYAGSITGNLTVTANATGGAALSYQWFRSTSNSNAGGTAIAGATGASMPIPLDLMPGAHFFFSEVSAVGAVAPIRSNVATVMVFEFDEDCEL